MGWGETDVLQGRDVAAPGVGNHLSSLNYKQTWAKVVPCWRSKDHNGSIRLTDTSRATGAGLFFYSPPLNSLKPNKDRSDTTATRIHTFYGLRPPLCVGTAQVAGKFKNSSRPLEISHENNKRPHFYFIL